MSKKVRDRRGKFRIIKLGSPVEYAGNIGKTYPPIDGWDSIATSTAIHFEDKELPGWLKGTIYDPEVQKQFEKRMEQFKIERLRQHYIAFSQEYIAKHQSDIPKGQHTRQETKPPTSPAPPLPGHPPTERNL